MTWDQLWIGGHLASFDPGSPHPYGQIMDGALGVKDGAIVWVGPEAALPGPPDALARTVTQLSGAWMTPGLVDCHTHLVFGGNRAGEFEQRLSGVPYEDIAKKGGGIASTVRETRAASEDALYDSAAARLSDLKRQGVTTVEVKSGYGLTLDDEIKMLRVAGRITREHVRISRSFLGAHAVPPEFSGRADAYMDYVIDDMLPVIAREGLADSVDAYCESIGFSTAQCARLFEAASGYGLPVRLHAEQLSNMGGSRMAASFGALSVDHLEYLSPEDIPALAKSGTVAVLLPAAFYTLRQDKLPPIKALEAAGVSLALATDCNPGTSPVTSPLMVLNMACTLFGLTPEAALRAMTLGGARALGLGDKIGSLELGKRADLAVWDVASPAELAYWIGKNPLLYSVLDGAVLNGGQS